jgi:hypothetical protein
LYASRIASSGEQQDTVAEFAIGHWGNRLPVMTRVLSVE